MTMTSIDSVLDYAEKQGSTISVACARAELASLRVDRKRLNRLNRTAIKAKEVAEETRRLGHPNSIEYFRGIRNFAASVNSALEYDQWEVEDFTKLSPLAGKLPGELESGALDNARKREAAK